MKPIYLTCHCNVLTCWCVHAFLVYLVFGYSVTVVLVVVVLQGHGNTRLHIILISPLLIIALDAMDWSFTYTVGESVFTDEYVL